MIIKLPENAKKILDTMHKAGFEAYVVGGCVRDALLSREPGDRFRRSERTGRYVPGGLLTDPGDRERGLREPGARSRAACRQGVRTDRGCCNENTGHCRYGIEGAVGLF